MPYSKRELIYAALEEIGIASYNFDLQAEQVLSAGNMLDAMMAEWDARGIHVGYPITSPTTIDLDASVGFPAWVNEAARTGLAIRVAPSYGRTPSPNTMMTAKSSFATVVAKNSSAPFMSFPDTLPAGAGNNPWLLNQDPYIRPADDDLLAGDEGELTFE